MNQFHKVNYLMGLLVCWLGFYQNTLAQSGNYVQAGAEAVNFGTIQLNTTTWWATARTATPGYFASFGTATYTGASDASNINGYVKQYVTAANQGFTFPVGTGSDLRTLTTSGSIPAGLVYATAWLVGDPGSTTDPTDMNTHSTTALGTGLAAVSTTGQWDWVVSTGSANGVTVTVSIPDMASFGAASLLRLVGWNGNQWINLSGSTGATGNSENSTLTGTMVAGITAVGIGLGVLPAAATVDCAQTQIMAAPVAGTASQHVLVVTANVTAPGSLSVSVTGSGITLANGVTMVSTNRTGVQQFFIPVNYDGSVLGSLTFSVGSSSCTTNLTGPPKQMISNVWTLACVPTVGPVLK